MTKILITGGAGFIGAHLTNKLSKIKNKILVVDLLKVRNYPFFKSKNNLLKVILQKNILKKLKMKPEVIYP